MRKTGELVVTVATSGGAVLLLFGFLEMAGHYGKAEEMLFGIIFLLAGAITFGLGAIGWAILGAKE